MHPFLPYQLARPGHGPAMGAVRRLLVITALVFAATGTAHADAAFVQQATLTASDAAAQDKLGARVAVSGSTMVVGSVAHNSDGSSSPGAVYVFEKPPSGWADAQKTATLRLPAGAHSITAVAMSGDTIAVGALDAKVGANDGQGAVYIFVRPAAGWEGAQPVATLTASDGAAADQFGFAVAMNGDTVVTSAPLHKVGANVKQGAAYVFVKPASGWASAHETAELTASDGAANDLLRPVAIDGDTIVAGAQAHKVGANFSQGEAYVFVKPAAGWTTATETAKLTTATGVIEDFFGFTVGVSGDTVIVGAPDRTTPGRPMHAGAVEVFVKPASGWATATETAELTASDGAINDELGTGAAVSGDTIVAGAASHTVGQNGSQGSAYVFTRRAGSGWTNSTEDQRLLEAVGGTLDQFGDFIALSGNVALISAHARTVGGKNMAGAAYVFGVPPSIAIASPLDGSTFKQGQSVAASYTCTPPAGSAIASCSGPVAPGARIDTSSLGSHSFTVNALDSEGVTASRTVSYAVGPKAPSITGLKQSSAKWREAGRRPIGTTFSFRLDQPARLALRFTRHGKAAGSLAVSAHAGLNKVRFKGRISRKRKLAPGRYTLRITATNETGQRATSRALTFRIVGR